MKLYEELARMKANEVIQNGINAQRIHRELHGSKRQKLDGGARLKYFQAVIIIVVISLTLAGTAAALNIF